MKIGIKTDCDFTRAVGVDNYTLYLVRALMNQGHNLTFYQFKKSSLLKGTNNHYFRSPLPLPFYRNFASLTHNKCYSDQDLVHFPCPGMDYLIKPKTAVVMNVHDLMPLIYPGYFPKQARIFFRYFLPKYLKAASALITSSESAASDICRFFPSAKKKIHLVYNYIPTKDQTILYEKKPYILYLGTIQEKKNIRNILKAFSILKSKGFEHQLILAGKVDNFSLEDVVKQLKIEKDVIYKGYITEAEKEELLQNTSLFLWPSYYEGFGYPLLEAMAHGAPIITSNNSSMKEVCKNSGLLVDPFNPYEIADAAEEVLSSSAVRNDLIKKGLKRSKDYTEKRMTEELIKVYQSVTR